MMHRDKISATHMHYRTSTTTMAVWNMWQIPHECVSLFSLGFRRYQVYFIR